MSTGQHEMAARFLFRPHPINPPTEADARVRAPVYASDAETLSRSPLDGPLVGECCRVGPEGVWAMIREHDAPEPPGGPIDKLDRGSSNPGDVAVDVAARSADESYRVRSGLCCDDCGGADTRSGCRNSACLCHAFQGLREMAEGRVPSANKRK